MIRPSGNGPNVEQRAQLARPREERPKLRHQRNIQPAHQSVDPIGIVFEVEDHVDVGARR